MNLISELLTDSISEERRNELSEIQRELHRIQESNFAQFHIDVNRMKHEFPRKLGFNAYFADTSKIISLNDVLQDKALLALMKYSEEEYLQVGEKAEVVNEAFRNTPSYNNLNIESDLAGISVPVEVIQGEEDFVVGTEHAQLIYDALTNLSNDRKEIHLIPNTGHCPAIESLEIFLEILNGFLKKHNKI